LVQDRLLGFEEVEWLHSLGAVGIGNLQMMVCGLDLCSFCVLILTIPSSAWPASIPHGFDFLFTFITPRIRAEQDIGVPVSHNPKSFLIFLVTDYSSYSFYQTAGILN